MSFIAPPAARLFAVVGPSGAGKDTLIRAAVAADPSIHWARRAITRPPAPTEPFESLDPLEFAARLKAGDFALHWEAHGLRYGVPQAELAPLEAGRTVIFNGSRAALPKARILFPDMGVILITAPVEVLAARLAARGRETEADVAARLRRAGFELPRSLSPAILTNDSTPEAGAARLLQLLGRRPASQKA